MVVVTTGGQLGVVPDAPGASDIPEDDGVVVSVVLQHLTLLG